MKAIRAIRSLATLVLFATLPACGARTEVHTVTADENVIVEGVELPAVLAVYRVANVQKGPAADAGSFVRYVPDDSLAAALPRIDLIVYPAKNSLDAEIVTARYGLLAYDRRSPDISETRFEDEGQFLLERSGETAYRASLYMEVAGQPSRSLFYLHRTGPAFLKARATFPLRSTPSDAAVVEIVDFVVSALMAEARPVESGT